MSPPNPVRQVFRQYTTFSLARVRSNVSVAGIWTGRTIGSWLSEGVSGSFLIGLRSDWWHLLRGTQICPLPPHATPSGGFFTPDCV